ncbi:PIN domain-containing protein [Micromonospora matsumotoense]|uniref:PIN domain-containing protein n=1 Tax=Micromonospora matsumotoense TaxID=121616 RepID=UPI0033E7E42E
MDANVLIPNALCDFLLRLAEEDLYQPRWSPDILAEVRRHVPVPAAAIDRRIAFMNAAFEDALVTGYETLIDQMSNDPKDRHVLAAAVATGADSIITCNLRDFPLAACEPHGVVAEHSGPARCGRGTGLVAVHEHAHGEEKPSGSPGPHPAGTPRGRLWTQRLHVVSGGSGRRNHRKVCATPPPTAAPFPSPFSTPTR